MAKPDVKNSEQSVLNRVFNETYEVLEVANMGYNGTGLQSLPTPFLTLPYDTVVITYTDSTKSTIATVETKLDGNVQETITLTQASTTDTYTRS